MPWWIRLSAAAMDSLAGAGAGAGDPAEFLLGLVRADPGRAPATVEQMTEPVTLSR